MTIKQAIKILKRANRWRRGAEIEMPDPKEFGEATDIAKVGYDCHKCKHSFSNPFDQYYCQKIDENGEEYDLEADKDCKGIYYER